MQNLRTQDEIIHNWIGNIEKPQLTVLCTTYNHEKYIEETIQGFLIQETDFPFEIIIHDDASTDHTADIIRRYEARFPKLIRAVYQTVNRFSQGKRNGEILYPMAQGKYIALCDGDDYWTDTKKLQIQVDEMKRYPECNISFHYAIKKHEDNSHEDELFCKHADKNKFFTTKDIIYFGGPLMPTSSIVLRKQFTDFIVNTDDEFFKKNMTGFFIQFFASLDGNARYINKNMSVYRSMGKGSWTESISNDYHYFIEWANKSIHSLEVVDNLTNLKYTKELKSLKKRHYLSLMYRESIPIEKRKYFYNKYKKELGIKEKFILNFVYPYPVVFRILVSIKKTVLNIKVKYLSR